MTTPNGSDEAPAEPDGTIESRGANEPASVPEPRFPDPPRGVFVVIALGLLSVVFSGLLVPVAFREGELLLGGVLLFLIACLLAILWGLLLLQRWALLGAYVFYGIDAVVGFTGGDPIGAIVNVVILVYLSSVAELFE